MSNHGASKDEGFGKDLGVMHEASVTGRKVGLDKDFFAALAHDEGLFYRTIAFVKNGGTNPYTDYEVARFVMGKENFIGPEEYWTIMKREQKDLFLPDDGMVPFTRRMLEDVKDTHVLIKVGHYFTIRESYGGEIQTDEGALKTNRGTGGWHLIRKSDAMGIVGEAKVVPPKGIIEWVPSIQVLLHAAVVYALHNPGKKLFSGPIMSGTHYGNEFRRRRVAIAPLTGKKYGFKISLHCDHDDTTGFRASREVWSI